MPLTSLSLQYPDMGGGRRENRGGCSSCRGKSGQGKTLQRSREGETSGRKEQPGDGRAVHVVLGMDLSASLPKVKN